MLCHKTPPRQKTPPPQNHTRWEAIFGFFSQNFNFFFFKKNIQNPPWWEAIFYFFWWKNFSKKKSPTWWVFGHFIFINLKFFSPDKSQNHSDFVKNPINHSDFVKFQKKKKLKIGSHQGLSLVRAHFFFFNFTKSGWFWDFFEGENFQIYKYKMAKNQPGGWFFFSKNYSSKKVKNGLPLGRILNVFFWKKKS